MNSNIKDDYEMKQQTSQKHDVTVAEIEAMGGKSTTINEKASYF